MCEQEFALYGDIVGTGGFAGAIAAAADIGFHSGNLGVFKHGLFFAALGYEVVVIPHDGVDRNSLRALRFALAACVTTVKFPASLSISIQFSLIGFGQFGP